MERISYSKEPVLHIHKYVMVLLTPIKRKNKYKTGYWYALTLKEVNERRRKVKPGTIVEVYKAHHDFREAWLK